jgi:enoyl-CoA hydratase/carnithine racemase
MSMNYQHIELNVKDKIAWLIFNRPEQLNAMNAQMMNEIIHALAEIDAGDPSKMRVAVLTGRGKAFMAGADIKEYARQTPLQFNRFQSKGYTLYKSIEANSKPIIAAINGYAFGGGLEIALACDMIVAVQGAKMGLPEILLNLIPGGGGSPRLSKKIGVNLANEMIMTGRTVLAEELHGFGLVNHIYPMDCFIEKVTEFARLFSDKESDRLLAIKKLTQLSAGRIPAALQKLENAALKNFYKSKEAKEKIEGFYKKSQEKKK